MSKNIYPHSIENFVKTYSRDNIDHGYLLSAIFKVNKEMLQDYWKLTDDDRRTLYIFIHDKIAKHLTNGI